MNKKKFIIEGVTIGFVNHLIVLLICAILSIAYFINASKMTESDNVGMILVPSLLVAVVLPVVGLILSLVELGIMSLIIKRDFTESVLSLLFSILVLFLCVVSIPVVFILSLVVVGPFII